MTFKKQQEQIKRLQSRIAELVEELRITQSDVKNFKESVARDMQRAFELIKENK